MASKGFNFIMGVGCGILGITVVVLGFIAVSCTACAVTMSESLVEADLAKAEALNHVAFEEVEGSSGEGFFTVKGYVRNDGTTAIGFVKIAVELLDEENRVLDTNWTYAVGGEMLHPGQRQSFQVLTPATGQVSRFRYFVMTD